MPSARSVVIAALLGLGVGAGGMLAFDIRDGDEPAAVATTSSTAPVETETWVSEHETRLGAAALVPVSLALEGGDLVLVYDMVPLTPGSFADDTVNHGGLSAPARFTMTWAGGEVAAEVIGPSNRAVRFDVPDGFTMEALESIEVDSYWTAAPARIPAVFDPAGATWSELAPGVVARISAILDQPNNLIVKVEWGGEPGRALSLFVAGDEREWARVSGSMIGQSVWTLDFRGDVLPDPLVLNAIGVAWVEVQSGVPVDLGGLSS